MTYDSLLQPFKGLVITEVASFKEKRLVTPEGGEGEKGILNINLSMQGIEPWSPGRKARVLKPLLVKS